MTINIPIAYIYDDDFPSKLPSQTQGGATEAVTSLLPIETQSCEYEHRSGWAPNSEKSY
jgi:hypothetical protein